MNIDRILCFKKDGDDGPVMQLAQLRIEFGREFDGTNFYYGINEPNRDTFGVSGAALNDTHVRFFDGIRDALIQGDVKEAMVMLGLEPPQLEKPYEFVDANLGLVRQLARELNQYQAEASEAGKTLRIVVRYASEMNDKQVANRYAGDPQSYARSFAAVRSIFGEEAKNILFAFSPAIRADLSESGLSGYWPGDDHVDVISCTWYIGSPEDAEQSSDFFKAYVSHRKGKGKLFGIDELGGCRTINRNGAEHGAENDAFLQRMFGELKDLQGDGIHFSHVTIFLEGKWGDDAKLHWLAA